jgi:hypothetical protein
MSYWWHRVWRGHWPVWQIPLREWQGRTFYCIRCMR